MASRRSAARFHGAFTMYPACRVLPMELLLIDLLEAELQRCKAEFEAANAALKQIIVNADPQRKAELVPAIQAALERLKEANDRLQDAISALRKNTSRVQ